MASTARVKHASAKAIPVMNNKILPLSRNTSNIANLKIAQGPTAT